MQVHALKHGVSFLHGVFHGTVRAKAVTVVAEFRFADWLYDLFDTLLYQIQGIPNGLVFPFGFGMSLRLTGFGRYPC